MLKLGGRSGSASKRSLLEATPTSADSQLGCGMERIEVEVLQTMSRQQMFILKRIPYSQRLSLLSPLWMVTARASLRGSCKRGHDPPGASKWSDGNTSVRQCGTSVRVESYCDCLLGDSPL